MKRLILLLIVILNFGAIFAQSLVNDPSYSNLNFSVSHLKISSVQGEFKDFNVQLSSFDPNNIALAKFYVVANINSVVTGIQGRDDHLKSIDFFDSANYPKLEFKTKTISKIKKNRYKLVGDLTLRGVTKLVSLIVVYNGEDNVNGNIVYNFTVKGKIDRTDYGIGADFSNASVGHIIEISSTLQFLSSKNK